MKYLVDNPTAKPSDVAKACKCSVKYVYSYQVKGWNTEEVFEKEETKHNIGQELSLQTANDARVTTWLMANNAKW